MPKNPVPAPIPEASPVVERPRPLVGCNVRRWRKERGLTLAQVAVGSGLNVGYLSQIENEKASPSLESLAALAAAIDVPITWFLLDQAEPPRVVRATECRRWEGPGGGHIEEVDGGRSRDVYIVRATMESGQRTGLHAHAGDEHHVVLAGRMRLSQGEHTIDLGPGDYLAWDATIPHDAATIGEEPAVVLIISHRAHGTETARPVS